jgi:hypothetical protein
VTVGAAGGHHERRVRLVRGKSEGQYHRWQIGRLGRTGYDPLRVDPMSLIEVPIERTIVGGRWVYESWFQETACPRARLSEVVMFTEPRP